MAVHHCTPAREIHAASSRGAALSPGGERGDVWDRGGPGASLQAEVSLCREALSIPVSRPEGPPPSPHSGLFPELMILAETRKAPKWTYSLSFFCSSHFPRDQILVLLRSSLSQPNLRPYENSALSQALRDTRGVSEKSAFKMQTAGPGNGDAGVEGTWGHEGLENLKKLYMVCSCATLAGA